VPVNPGQGPGREGFNKMIPGFAATFADGKLVIEDIVRCSTDQRNLRELLGDSTLTAIAAGMPKTTCAPATAPLVIVRATVTSKTI